MKQDEAISKFDQSGSDAKKQLWQDGFDEGKASVVTPSGGSFSQADMDQAVSNAKAADAQSLSDLQSQLDAAKAKDDADVAALASEQAMIDKVKAALGL